MMKISDTEYAEYQRLLQMSRHQIALDAYKETRSLGDDIDTPIKKCVMAFALLGCAPIWSCCGFDYNEQPVYKWHQYGRTYFELANNHVVRSMLSNFAGISRGGWIVRSVNGNTDLHCNFYHPIPQWGERDSFHYHEVAAVEIALLENHLLSLWPHFVDSIELVDTNELFHDSFSSWQLTPHDRWVIKKEDLLDEGHSR